MLRRVDLADLSRRYADAAGRVTERTAATGGRVLLFTSITRAGGTGRLAQRLADRFAAAVLEHLGVDDPVLLGGSCGWWRERLPPGPASRRRDDVVADLVWVRGHLVPWVGRRLRGVSSGDGLAAKDPVPRPVGVP